MPEDRSRSASPKRRSASPPRKRSRSPPRKPRGTGGFKWKKPAATHDDDQPRRDFQDSYRPRRYDGDRRRDDGDRRRDDRRRDDGDRRRDDRAPDRTPSAVLAMATLGRDRPRGDSGGRADGRAEGQGRDGGGGQGRTARGQGRAARRPKTASRPPPSFQVVSETRLPRQPPSS